MQEAGSAWYFNLTNDLLVRFGHQDARRVRERWYLRRIMARGSCNASCLTPPKLALLPIPHLQGETFAVNSHQGPTWAARRLISCGVSRRRIYRPPCDAAVSAFDHGQKFWAVGSNRPLARLKSIEDAIVFAHALDVGGVG